MNIEELVAGLKEQGLGDDEIRAEANKLKPVLMSFLLVVEEQPQAEQTQAVETEGR